MQSLKRTFLTTVVFLHGISSYFAHAEESFSASPSLECRLQQLREEDKEKRIRHLYDLYWDWRMAENPDEASYYGHPGLHGTWPDMSIEALDRRQHFTSQLLEILITINPDDLLKQDKMSYSILKRILEEDIANMQFGSHYLLVNQMHGIHLHIPLIIEFMPSKSLENYENILSRLRLIPEFFQQIIQLLEKGIELGITPPRVAMLNVPQQILNQIYENPTDSSLLKAFLRFPNHIDIKTQEHLLLQAKEVYLNAVVPAFIQLYSFLTERYLPNCRKSIGFTELPNGKDWYAHVVKSSTTTSLTPLEIHEIGLKEVNRVYGEMLAIIQKTGFKGSFVDFLHFIKSDPQFFYNNREELLEGYRALARHIESKLSHLFESKPILPFEVIPVPSYSEESQIGAYYCPGSIANHRPGYFFINTSHHEEKPKWEMEPLTLHEAVPGHHLQISLAQELQGIPEFRKNAHFTAYIEGWGLYSESLGTELGLYKDAYSNFGRLSYEMLRAIRLVVDTGMHALGWSREDAIQYFKQYVGMSNHEIATEVDRYLVMPGQALAYKIGELKIKQMRSLSREQLRAKFDIRKISFCMASIWNTPIGLGRRKHSWMD